MEQMDSSKIQELPFDNFPRLKKAKTVNFCPYCRAVVAAVPTLPFIFLWRLYPHKPKPKKTHADIMKSSERRSKYTRYAAAGGMLAIGAYHTYNGDWYWLPFYIGLAAFNIRSPEILKWSAMRTNNFFVRIEKWLERRRADKPKKVKKAKKPSMILSKLHKEHEKICPPVFFVTGEKKEDMR